MIIEHDVITFHSPSALQKILYPYIDYNIDINMNVFMLVVSIVGSIICVIVDIYIMALYSHQEESNFSPITIFCKVLIILTLFQVQLQFVLLLFDVENSRQESTDFTVLWAIVYSTIYANIALLKPIATSTYQSDPQDSLIKRALWVIAEVVITLIVFGVLLGVGWLLWGFTYLPVQEISVLSSMEGVEGENIVQQALDTYIQIQVSVPCYLIGLLCLLGYPLLVFCAACGMTALPFSLIVEFRDRPKWRRTHEAKRIKEQLQSSTVRLIKTADYLRRSINRVEYVDGWFSKRSKKSQLTTQLDTLENQLLYHRTFFELFKLELNMVDVNPWVYIFKLVLAICCFIFGLFWLLQIVFTHFVATHTFIDHFLTFLEAQNASFISIAFLIILGFYLIAVTIKGIIFVSEHSPFIKIHPITPGKTWLNSFLFQLTLAVIATTSMLHMLVITFPEYLRGADLVLVMDSVLSGMQFVGFFLRNKIFIYAYLVMVGLSFFFTGWKILCSNTKSEALKEIEAKRRQLFGKQKENQPMIQMTQLNLNESDKKVKEKGEKKLIEPMKRKRKK